MKKIKKCIALFLTLCIILSTQTMAATVSELNIMTAQMQSEVQRMVQNRLEEVAPLFEGKSPGYLYAYTEYLTALYEQIVIDESGITSFASKKYLLLNGGTASYTTRDAGGDYFDVVILMFDKEDSYDYLLNNWSPGEYDLGDFFTSVIGYTPGLGDVFSPIFEILDGATAIFGLDEWEQIQAADGYVMVETVSARGYPGDPVAMITGWSTHPYYIPYDTLPSDLEIEIIGFNKK